jgi:hypothetical protein
MGSRKFLYIFYALQASALTAMLVPFLRWNNLLEWDFPGHYAAIWYMREFLLPWATGWNPFFYCGYPQGLFYPPLAHYVAALLSFWIGIAPAMKLLLALSVLVLPVSFYAFARRWGLDDLQSAVCATSMTSMLFVRGEMLGVWNLGSDLHSILHIGLFANTISLPVLFLFMATFGRHGQGKQWKLPALLFAVLLLLHPLSSLIAGIFVLGFLASQVWRRSQGAAVEWRSPFQTLATGAIAGCAWVLPFACYRSYMAESYVAPQWSLLVVFTLFNGLVLALIAFRSDDVRPLSATYLILANFILLGAMWQIGIEWTRLTIYLLLMIPVFLIVCIRSRAAVATLAVLALLGGYAGYRKGDFRAAGVPDFPLPDFGPVSGRILSVAPPSHLSSYHVHHDLIPLRTGNASTLGLFIQSSPNGRFLANISKSLDPAGHIWGTSGEWLRTDVLGSAYPAYIRARLRLFDVRHIYTDLKLENVLDPSLASTKRYINSYPIPKILTQEELRTLRSRYNSHDDLLDFYLYPVGPSTLVEPLTYVPAVVKSEWKPAVQKWFLEKTDVPIFTDRACPPDVRAAQAGESIELLASSPRLDRLTLRINAPQNIPVLVKVGYFPTWKLTVNGNPGEVYRASPNLLLIFAHGEAMLELKRPWQEYAGLGLTLAGLAALILL